MEYKNTGLDAKNIAKYIAQLNINHENHAGYCGEKESEIFDVLKSEFSDLSLEESVSIVIKDGEISGLLGLDVDIETKTAELWGPFIADLENWNSIATELCEECLDKVEEKVNCFLGFYNIKNTNANNFMLAINAKERGEHKILKIKKENYVQGGEYIVEEISMPFYKHFSKLHAQSFPNTYYSSDYILENLDENNKLFIIKRDNILIGYSYIEGNLEHKEGSIEYITVSPEYRQKGFGVQLLRYSTDYLINSLKVEEISICVESKNTNAIKMYERSGYQLDSVLKSYVFNNR